MKIETKFNKGEKVYFMEHLTVSFMIINHIHTDDAEVSYTGVSDHGDLCQAYEDNLFRNPQEAVPVIERAIKTREWEALRYERN